MRAQWLFDGACSAACHYHGRQTNHQQRSRDCHTVSTSLSYFGTVLAIDQVFDAAILDWTGRGLGQRALQRASRVIPRLLLRKIFTRPGPPQLPNPTW